jgi:hypothetical protein
MLGSPSVGVQVRPTEKEALARANPMTQLWRVRGFSADEAAHAAEINLHIPVFLRQMQEEQVSAAAQRLTHMQ